MKQYNFKVKIRGSLEAPTKEDADRKLRDYYAFPKPTRQEIFNASHIETEVELDHAPDGVV